MQVFQHAKFLCYKPLKASLRLDLKDKAAAKKNIYWFLSGISTKRGTFS